jgi:hypothetical protein
MNKKSKLLLEDNQMLYNKWVSGIAKREAPSDVITVDDIVNRYRNNLNNQAPKILPYPLNSLLDCVGNIFIKAADVRRLLIDSSKYPLIKEDKKKLKCLESLNKKMKEVQDILYSCTEEFNILVEDRKGKIK